MNAIEILRAASRSVPNEDYVQFMAAVDAVEMREVVLRNALECIAASCDGDASHVASAALANVGGA